MLQRKRPALSAVKQFIDAVFV